MNLTPRNVEVLEAIYELHDADGFMPTVRELGARLGMSSPSTVHDHLRRLERGLLIERKGTRLRLTDLGRNVVAGRVVA